MNEPVPIPETVEVSLRRANPWWEGLPQPVLPPMRRWAFKPVLQGLKSGLTPAVALRGPRQVGKTTLLGQAIAALLSDGIDPRRILRVQFDELPDLAGLTMPILQLAWWYESHVLGESFNQAAHAERPAFLLFDEVQNLPDWAPQLKHLVDLNTVRVLITGSSALRIEAGRDSLAGRITTIEMGPLLLREIAAIRRFGEIAPCLPHNGLAPLRDRTFWAGLRAYGEANRAVRDAAFLAYSARGGYPVAQTRAEEPWERVADFLTETVINRALQHDLQSGPRGDRRDEHLLAEVFRLACRYAGQSPTQAVYLQEIRHALHADVGWRKVLAYLKFLDGTLLVRLIEPLELRLKRRRGPAKLCLCDHTLRAAWLQEIVPLAPEALRAAPQQADLAGRIAESTAGYFFRSIPGLDVAHFPERGAEPEVDFVLTVGDRRIPVEVKYRRQIEPRDTLGLRAFIEKAHYNAPFGVLVTLLDEPGSDDPRIVSLPLSSLLLLR